MSDEAFARSVLKIAVAQACNQMNFTNIETSAMEVLIDLLQFFFAQVGSGAAINAEITGRSECNYYDIKKSFEELGLATMDELARFLEHAVLPTWPRESVQHFAPRPTPAPTVREPVQNFPPYIPPFLPPYPDNRTYTETPIYNRPDYDPSAMNQLKLGQRREAENNLSKLSKVGTRNIINYDQVYDPRPTQHAPLPFQTAKDPAEMARDAEAKTETVRPGPAPTGVSRERLQHLLDPTGATQHMDDFDYSKDSGVDAETQRRVDQVSRVEHGNNSIHSLSDRS